VNPLDAALATPGIGWLLLAASVGGLARGFAGFGSGLILLPVAAAVVSPWWALASLAVLDTLGTLPLMRRAWRDAHRIELLPLILGMLLFLPVGLFLLSYLPVAVFRWAVTLSVLALLAALLTGWRWRGRRDTAMTSATGALAGFVGGAAGLAGPPVILYYLASMHSPAQIRANLMIFFVFFNAAMLVMLALMARLEAGAVALGLLLLVPFALANLIGAALFRPANEGLYRTAAYVLIGCAAVLGMPAMDGLLGRG
jgi:uncharacterized membrane protein YfcA